MAGMENRACAGLFALPAAQLIMLLLVMMISLMMMLDGDDGGDDGDGDDQDDWLVALHSRIGLILSVGTSLKLFQESNIYLGKNK